MTPTGGSVALRRRIPRPLVAASGATLLAAAGGLAWVQSGAGADPVSQDVPATCSILGSDNAVAVPMTVDDAVDPIGPGEAQTLSVTQGLGSLPVEVTVNSVVVTTPIPAQIASTDSVTFEGGNMAGSYAVDGQNLVVTFTGPQTSSQLQFPTVVVQQTVSDAPTGEAIEWKVWSSMLVDTNYGQATCTPDDPSTNLNTTALSGGGSPTTTTPDGGDGTPSTTLPDGTPPTTVPDGTPPTTVPTTPPTTPPGTPAPGASICVEVTSPLPLPAGAIPCPITVPPDGGGGLPVPPPGGSGGLPVPLPVPGEGGLPLPLPGGSGGLPVPVPPPGGIDLGIDLQIGVSL